MACGQRPGRRNAGHPAWPPLPAARPDSLHELPAALLGLFYQGISCLRTPRCIWGNFTGQSWSVASITSRRTGRGRWLGDLSKMALPDRLPFLMGDRASRIGVCGPQPPSIGACGPQPPNGCGRHTGPVDHNPHLAGPVGHKPHMAAPPLGLGRRTGSHRERGLDQQMARWADRTVGGFNQDGSIHQVVQPSVAERGRRRAGQPTGHQG